ncbi:MAG: hypothetical protein C4324_07095 [Blastocatellia bacterium]
MRHDAHYVEQIAKTSRTVGRMLPIDKVYPNPEQPRTEFGDLGELTASIREKGVLEPLLVRPNEDGTFMIIAGERRWRASKDAGLTEIPCIEMQLDEQGVVEIALIENLQRKDLNIWEEADGLAALAEKFGYTQEQIATKISKSRTTVTELVTIAGLPEDVRHRCREAGISSKSTLLEIARQFDDAAMHEFLDGLIAGKIKPKSKKAKAESETAAAGVKRSEVPDTLQNELQFRSASGKYEVVIRFREKGPASRVEILKLLKEAFESVKNDGALIQ